MKSTVWHQNSDIESVHLCFHNHYYKPNFVFLEFKWCVQSITLPLWYFILFDMNSNNSLYLFSLKYKYGKGIPKVCVNWFLDYLSFCSSIFVTLPSFCTIKSRCVVFFFFKDLHFICMWPLGKINLWRLLWHYRFVWGWSRWRMQRHMHVGSFRIFM